MQIFIAKDIKLKAKQMQFFKLRGFSKKVILKHKEAKDHAIKTVELATEAANLIKDRTVAEKTLRFIEFLDFRYFIEVSRLQAKYMLA